jgi:hypothetical protein
LLGAQGFVSKSHLAATLLNAVDVIVRKQTFFEGDEVRSEDTILKKDRA